MQVDRRLASLVVPFDEWETLYRKRLQVERDGLRSDVQATQPRSGPTGASAGARGPSVGELGLAVLGLGLVAVDVLLLLAQRRSARQRGPRG